MEIVWVFLFSGLFELSMIVFIVLANNAMQGEEERQQRLEQLELGGRDLATRPHTAAA